MSNQNERSEELFNTLSQNKKKKKRKLLRTVISIFVIVALLLVGIVIRLRNKVEDKFAVAGAQVLTYNVSAGTIHSLVSGSGTLEYVDLETLTAFQNEADDGTLQRCMFAYTEWIRESFLFSEESVQEFQKYLRTRFLFYRDHFRKGGIQTESERTAELVDARLTADVTLSWCEGFLGVDKCSEKQKKIRRSGYLQ